MVLLTLWRLAREVWQDTMTLRREMLKRYPHLRGRE
jgi:hypothetical protein